MRGMVPPSDVLCALAVQGPSFQVIGWVRQQRAPFHCTAMPEENQFALELPQEARDDAGIITRKSGSPETGVWEELQ